MPPTNRSEALAKADELIVAMGALHDETQALRRYGRRNRAMTWVALISVSLDMVLSVVLGLVVIKVRRVSDEARTATGVAAESIRKQTLTCEISNEARAAQRDLWAHVLDLSAATTPQTPDAVRQWQDFREYIRVTFAPRDCSQYEKPTSSLQDFRPTIAPNPR